MYKEVMDAYKYSNSMKIPKVILDWEVKVLFIWKVEEGLGFLDDKGKKYPRKVRKSYISLAQKQASSKIKCG